MSNRTAVFKQYTVTLIRQDGVETAYDGDLVAAVTTNEQPKLSAVAVTVPYSRRLPAETWLRHLLAYVDARPQVSAEWKAVLHTKPDVHVDKRAKSVYILWHTGN